MSPEQKTGDSIDMAAIFFEKLDDSRILDAHLIDWVNGLPPGAFTAFSDAIGALEPAQNQWDSGYFHLQKLAAGRNFSKDRIIHLLEIRRKARTEGWAGLTASAPPPASATTLVSQPASRTESRSSALFVPSDGFRSRFEKVSLEQAWEAMQTELGNAENTTEELKSLAEWCEKCRPDIFEIYAADDYAQPVTDVPSPASVEEDFYVQRAWLYRNFSKKRFLAAVMLRDLLRRQGKLLAQERVAPLGIDPPEEVDSIPDKIIEWLRTHQYLIGATFLAVGFLVVLAYWAGPRNK